MGALNELKRLLVPDTRPGVEYRCTECAQTFDAPRDRCPECDSIDVREVGTAGASSRP